MKRITLVCGHYGSGKTNFSLNLALNAAKRGEKITLVDLDIVNPYFRMQIHPVLKELVGNLFDSEEDTEFLVTFLADGTVSTLIRWLNSSDLEPPEEMARRVRRTMVAISQAIVTTYEEEERKAAKE